MGKMEFYEVDGHQHFIPVKVIGDDADKKFITVEIVETGYVDLVQKVYSFPKEKVTQKVSVPKFVAEWIEETKEHRSNLSWIWEVYPNDPKIKKWLDTNTETFIRAWLDGYEVNHEQLYRVEIAGSALTKIIRDNHVRFKVLPVGDGTDIDNAKYTNELTEEEIKQVDERLWQFAKIVEEKDDKKST
ncbi:TPA: DUF1642 domain-containing protein [Streptococcus suis]